MKPDLLDLQIISLLQKDGQMTFTDMAKVLKVSQGLVQARYHRMIKAGFIKRAKIIVDFSKLGLPFSAGLEIKCAESEVNKIFEYINSLKLKNVFINCLKVIGSYNIFVVIDSERLMDIHRCKQLIKEHPGVLEVDISLKNTFSFNHAALNLIRLIEE